ncbi:MAG: hypothetical protein ACRD01_01155 [Terriglobales bacterium]
MNSEFTVTERRTLAALRTPERIQRFLDEKLAYNHEPGGDTIRSPRRVLRDRTAHCFEGALLAAAALREHGDPPLLLDLEAVRDSDHVIAVFRRHGHWGAIGKSNYSGLRFREPVYRSARELVMSYFEHYFNDDAEKTLRRYSRPVNLARFDRRGWTTAEDDLWYVAEHLVALPHYAVFRNGAARRLARVDARLYAAGRLGRSD